MSYFHRRHYTWELIHGSIQSIFLKENLCPFKDDLILKNPIYDIEWKTNRHTNMIQTQRHKVWNLQVYFHSDVDVKCQNDWWKYLAACEYLSPLLFFLTWSLPFCQNSLFMICIVSIVCFFTSLSLKIELAAAINFWFRTTPFNGIDLRHIRLESKSFI